MKNIAVSLMAASLFIVLPAQAAESKTGNGQAKQQEVAKQTNTAKKPASKSKSKWDKFTDSVKHGTKKPACNQQQHSLRQC